MIVSAEDFFWLEPPELYQLARGLEPIAPEITIVAYLRRQDRMALSQWAQGGQTIQSAAVFGCQTSPLRPLTPQMQDYLDYDARLSQWQAAFPQARIVTRVYDRALFPNGDVVQDFMSLLGLPMPDVEVPKDVNAAFGSTTVQFYYWLRAQGFHQGEIRAIIQRDVIEDTRLRTLPARADVAAFLAQFDDANRRLAARLGVDQAFDPDLSEYPEVATFAPLSDEFKLRNLMALTLSLRQGLST